MRSKTVSRLIALAVLCAGLGIARPASAAVEVIEGISEPTPAPAKPKAKTAPKPSQTEAFSPVAAAVAKYALMFLGTPYIWGGATPRGFDCSGFTQYTYAQYGVRIPRTADVQFAYAMPVLDPQPGDLVFFQTYEFGASHVGIYLGNGYFVHALGSSVHVSSFASGYFAARYLGARRVVS